MNPPRAEDQFASRFHSQESAQSEKASIASLVPEFVSRNWKEIAAGGVLLAAGATAAYFSHGRDTGLLRDALGAGEGTTAIRGLNADTMQRLRNTDHFVFDLDRTLIDLDKALPAVRNTMRDELSRATGLPHDQIKGMLDATETRLNSPFFYGNLNEIKPLQELYGGDLNHRFADVATKTKAAYYDALKASPETLDLLKQLRDLDKSVHIYTSSTPARALEKLEGAGLTNHFDTIFSTGSNAFEDTAASGLITKETTTANLVQMPEDAKAGNSGYEWILNHLNSKASKMTMTGDNTVEDIANAKFHGILTAQAKWFRNETPKTAVLPDLELTSPADLTNAVRAAYAQGRPA